jgi:hypothetical protein
MNRDLFDPPSIVKPADALAELAGRINAEHTEALAAARASLTHARNAGQLLLEAKKQCGHGQWLSWLKDHVRFSKRTAQAYMRVAERWGELESKAQATALLTIEDGLKLLAAPKEEEAVVVEDVFAVADKLAELYRAEGKAIRDGKLAELPEDVDLIRRSVCVRMEGMVESMRDGDPEDEEESRRRVVELKKIVDASGKLQTALADVHISCEYQLGKVLRSMKDKLSAMPEAEREKELAGLPADLRRILRKELRQEAEKFQAAHGSP